jgi:serine/threonine-protein phosphatase 5
MLILEGTEQLGNQVFEALTLKEQGNRLLSNFKYALAAEKYTEAIKLSPTAILLSNRAQALIKTESYGLAIQDANKAIR